MFVEIDELWVYDQVYLCTIFESSLNSLMYDWLSLQVSLNYQFGLAYWIDLSCNGRSAELWVQSCGVLPSESKGSKARIVLLPSRITRWGLHHIA